MTTSTNNRPTPIQTSDRADILDIVRGFALFGILVINIIGFSGYNFFTAEMKQQIVTYPVDKYLSAILTALAEGKFYSIFSLLFGIGFSIIFMRLKAKGISPFSIFYRRLFYLLVFGLIHIYFLWEGDILILYAVLGMLLPLFTNVSDRRLLLLAVLLILSPIVIDAAKVYFDYRPGEWLENYASSIDERNGVPLDDGYRRYLYSPGSGWVEFWNWQQSAMFYRFSGLLEDNRIPKVLGMFLLGYMAGRNEVYNNISKYGGLLKKVIVYGLIIGIPATLIMVYTVQTENWWESTRLSLTHTVSYALGVVPLALVYVSALSLLWVKRGGRSKLLIFAPVGRMALTNYIMQTVLGILIFYGGGLSLGGYIGPTYFLPIGILLFIFQVIFSSLWLQHFNYGPLEWLWRVLTYQKWIPIKKA